LRSERSAENNRPHVRDASRRVKESVLRAALCSFDLSSSLVNGPAQKEEAQDSQLGTSFARFNVPFVIAFSGDFETDAGTATV